MLDARITFSVVSHRQNALVNQLLGDLERQCGGGISIILTQNVSDPVALATGSLGHPVEVRTNDRVRGFGANHNAAFAQCRTPFFCVANPDIRLTADPFPALLASLQGERAGAAGPLVRSPSGATEDSARKFPTAASLIRKLFVETRAPDYAADRGPVDVDWLGGMFLLVRSDAFRAVGGFDENYFLYYEDVDLCRRLQAAGRSVVFVPGAEVVHDARRASRRDPRLALHHARSALRFLSRG